MPGMPMAYRLMLCVLALGVSELHPFASVTSPPPIAASSTGLTASQSCFPSSFQFTFSFIFVFLSSFWFEKFETFEKFEMIEKFEPLKPLKPFKPLKPLQEGALSPRNRSAIAHPLHP